MGQSRCTGDSGDIVVGWLVRLVAVLSVAGILVFDGVSVAVAGLAVTDTAARSARAASATLTVGGTAQAAYVDAVDAAVVDDDLNEVPAPSFLVAPDGTVTLTVRRTAPTLVLHHLPRSEEWLVQESTATHRTG